MRTDVAIIGAGYAGMSAALELTQAGYKVALFEKDSDVGGLAGTFELSPGVRLEKFYHHWFTSDTEILGLISELGLSESLKYNATNTGLFYANSVFRLSSPWDLLRFNPIPLMDRVRTGLMALYARRINNWKALESQTAEEWLIKVGGRRAYDVVWQPLLQGKFGREASNVSAVWFWNKLKLRGSSRNEKGAESLVYFAGGFGALTEALRNALEEKGVAVHLNSTVEKIETKTGRVTGVHVRKASPGQTAPSETFFVEASQVLGTAPLPLFLRMTPDLPAGYVKQAEQIRFLGNVCLVLRLDRSLSKTYWLNVADPTFPFVGIIEHTNFEGKENYGGEHIAYLSKYLPSNEALFLMSEEELFQYSVPFIKKIFPEFSESWVRKYHVWKTDFSQPVITKHYSTFIPDVKTPIDGLWLSTMAQIYPEDRGTNYAVRHGRAVAKRIIEHFSK